jgi:hypothetical protein
MAQHDFLGYVLPQARQPAPLTTERIPEGEALLARANAYEKELEALDLVALTDAEEKKLGPPATPEEIDLNDAYAELTEKVPELMDLLELPRTLMRDAVSLDQALLQVQGANRQLREATGVAGLLLAAELTAATDRVEEALSREVADGLASEEEHRQHTTLFEGVYAVRGDLARTQEEREQRQKRRFERLREQIREADRRSQVLLKMDEMARAPLPAADRRDS